MLQNLLKYAESIFSFSNSFFTMKTPFSLMDSTSLSSLGKCFMFSIIGRYLYITQKSVGENEFNSLKDSLKSFIDLFINSNTKVRDIEDFIEIIYIRFVQPAIDHQDFQTNLPKLYFQSQCGLLLGFSKLFSGGPSARLEAELFSARRNFVSESVLKNFTLNDDEKAALAAVFCLYSYTVLLTYFPDACLKDSKDRWAKLDQICSHFLAQNFSTLKNLAD